MTKRLLYTKEILTQMLNNKQASQPNPPQEKVRSARMTQTLLKSQENFRSQGVSGSLKQVDNFIRTSQQKR